MKITADTNVLVRAIVADDARQARRAQATLAGAEVIAIPSAALCEFVWVLSRGYAIPPADVAAAIHALVASANVIVDRPAVDAGLAVLTRGGDFADGVIAYEGARAGGPVFASFDKDAVKRLKALGAETLALG
ncbi:MAG: type II toxin-antitoxin system VapC family toxin [Alphaproteobacteria bacterium]|nr:type II toxin-antitoxin system VapC family toxin [Alphaproteobacteria bacterium]